MNLVLKLRKGEPWLYVGEDAIKASAFFKDELKDEAKLRLLGLVGHSIMFVLTMMVLYNSMKYGHILIAMLSVIFIVINTYGILYFLFKPVEIKIGELLSFAEFVWTNDKLTPDMKKYYLHKTLELVGKNIENHKYLKYSLDNINQEKLW